MNRHLKRPHLNRKQLQRFRAERTLSNRMQASRTDPGRANAQDSISLGKASGFGPSAICFLSTLRDYINLPLTHGGAKEKLTLKSGLLKF